MTRTLVITSGKGGVGKTNLSVNTSLELARRNFRTCLLDADLGLANVNILLGLHSEKTLEDCIFGDHKLDDIILHSDYGIDIIPGSSGFETLANLGQEKINDLFNSFSQLTDYDFLVIDTSSGISRNVISCCLASSETILVVTSEATSLADGYALLKVLASNSYKGSVKVIVNRCPDVAKSKETFLRLKKAVDKHLDIPITPIGTILNDPHFEMAIAEQEPILTLYPNSVASQCIRAMVSNLLDYTVHDDADFGNFWQLYYDFSQSDLKLPEQAERTPPSPQPSREKNGSHLFIQEKSQPQTPNPYSSSTDTPPEPEPESLEIDSLIHSLNLESPISLLSKSLELHGRGELTDEKLHKIFSSDPSLMIKALQVLESPGTNPSKRITSVQQVFLDLGPEVLSSILLTACMESAHSEADGLDPLFVDEFWCNSYKCALLAEFIAETVDYPYPEEAFLAGLFHDIGRLTLQSRFPDVYAKFPSSFSHKEILENERRILGTTHAEIGSKILRMFRINSFMADAVQYHAESDIHVETAFELVKIIFIASQVTGSPQEKSIKISELRSKSLLGLTSTQLLTGLEMVELRSQGLADHFHILLEEKAVQHRKLNSRTLFRRQAVEYTLLQGTMPSQAPVGQTQQIIHQLHKGLEILFSIKPVICLLIDKRQTFLQAVGYPDCFGWETLSDILLPLSSRKSIIVRTLTTCNMNYAFNDKEKSVLSLADEQLMRFLGKSGLVCIPMAAQRVSKGVIIFGMEKEDIQTIDKLQSRLEQFGAQSALNILVSEQLHGQTKEISQKHTEKSVVTRSNLIQLSGNQ